MTQAALVILATTLVIMIATALIAPSHLEVAVGGMLFGLGALVLVSMEPLE